jgi:hypothetical protein
VARLGGKLAQRDREVGALVARLEAGVLAGGGARGAGRGGSSGSGSGGSGSGGGSEAGAALLNASTTSTASTGSRAAAAAAAAAATAAAAAASGQQQPSKPLPPPPPLPPLPDGTPTPPQLCDDAELALEAFRSRHASREGIEDNKALLRSKVEGARCEAERVNSSRAKMAGLKEELDRRRLERAVGALEGGAGQQQQQQQQQPSAAERELLGAFEAEKAAYMAAFNALRALKTDIEQIQRLLEGARTRLEAEFQAWHSDCKAARAVAQQAQAQQRHHAAPPFPTLPSSLPSSLHSTPHSTPPRAAASAGGRLAGGGGGGSGAAQPPPAQHSGGGGGSGGGTALGELLSNTLGLGGAARASVSAPVSFQRGAGGGQPPVPPTAAAGGALGAAAPAVGKPGAGGDSVEDDIASFYRLKAGGKK